MAVGGWGSGVGSANGILAGLGHSGVCKWSNCLDGPVRAREDGLAIMRLTARCPVPLFRAFPIWAIQVIGVFQVSGRRTRVPVDLGVESWSVECTGRPPHPRFFLGMFVRWGFFSGHIVGSHRSRVCFMCDLEMVFVSCRVVMSHHLHAFIASVLGRSQCGHVPEGHAESMCVPWCLGRGLFTRRCCVRASYISFIVDCHWCDCHSCVDASVRLSVVWLSSARSSRCSIHVSCVRLSFARACHCAIIICAIGSCAISISFVTCAIVISAMFR